MTVTGKSVHKSSPLLAICVASLFSSLAFAESQTEQQAQQLLASMSEAARTLNYDGIFVYQRGDQMDAMRIVHQSRNGEERERLVSLTGYAREVIRNGNTVTCIFPDDQSVMIEKSRPYKLLSAQFPEPIVELADSYNFRLDGSDRTAGREAKIVRIQPRDRFRYGYRLWIDKQTNLLLKSELLNEQGQALEQFMYTQLEIVDELPDKLLEPTITGIDFTWYENPDDDHNETRDDTWQVSWLPNGFTISDSAAELLADSPRQVQHLVFSDGLALISVFVEPASQNNGPMIGPSRIGAVNAFARQAEGYQVMVVGEVPAITVRQMANSVAYQP